MSKPAGPLETLLIVPTLLVLFILPAVLEAYALRDLWVWFVVPLGVPTLTVPHALGFGLVFSLLAMQPGRTAAVGYWRMLGNLLSGIAILWTMGWVTHRWFM